ncbi:very long chain fatty acid elongase 6-like [Lineus longissimus]|uniref:very long chain fatty acid elongase 6-like n=1 Tax=Lineus longissimus TaxID=88925 RepID=UPI00315D8422
MASTGAHIDSMITGVNRTVAVVFDFEKKWLSETEPSFMNWMLKNWTMCFIYSLVYIAIVHCGRMYMENRPRYELRPALTMWSAILGAFSLMGAIRTWPELIYSIYEHGVQHSVCSPSYFYDPVTAFWSFMFTVSKVYELGDTMFIVLRKQQLIFLHWYHHVTVLIYVWYSYTERTAPGRWFMVMNYTVHAFMYTYYALRAMRVRIPKWVNIFITAMQLSQMIIGCTLNVWIYQIKERGETCHQSNENLQYSFVMYMSYFGLFAHFFYTTYMVKKEPTDSKIKSS